ncbi:MAG: redoxin family protein [Pirellulales bacterium]|nr:redoxin family protein [Pirellulales bacterium]
MYNFSNYRTVSLLVFFFLPLGCSDAPIPTAESKPKKSNVESTSADLESESAESSQPEEEASLKVGDAAPSLQIAEWVKGKPVESFRPGKVYVVEFWATWCGPCINSMPHISKLQEVYGEEVTFIGVTRESAEVVRTFLDKKASHDEATSGETWNDLLRYTLATDDEHATTISYRKAAQVKGIPVAFVVGPEGKIEWIDRPRYIDATLEKITQGTWDRQAGIEESIKRKKQEQVIQAIYSEIRQARQDKDWELALSIVAEHEDKLPETFPIKKFRFYMLNQLGRSEQAIQFLDEIALEIHDNARILNIQAWLIASNENSSEAVLRRTLPLAERACELTKYADGAALNTLARLHFELDDLKQAVTWQTQAVEASPEKEDFQKTLDKYKAALEENASKNRF